MISPRRVTEIRERVKWARDDVASADGTPKKKIKRGYLRMARRALDEAIEDLDRLAREAWEDE